MGRTIEADYLVVGAGAMGLAFTDTLVSETNACCRRAGDLPADE